LGRRFGRLHSILPVRLHAVGLGGRPSVGLSGRLGAGLSGRLGRFLTGAFFTVIAELLDLEGPRGVRAAAFLPCWSSLGAIFAGSCFFSGVGAPLVGSGLET
jgi:hypothetical protein